MKFALSVAKCFAYKPPYENTVFDTRDACRFVAHIAWRDAPTDEDCGGDQRKIAEKRAMLVLVCRNHD